MNSAPAQELLWAISFPLWLNMHTSGEIMYSNTFLPEQGLGPWIAASASGWPTPLFLQGLSPGSGQLSSRGSFADEHSLLKESGR